VGLLMVCGSSVGSVAYICGGELLIGGKDGAAALGGVESTLALDGGLTVSARSTDRLADLGDLVPVAHCEGVVGVLEKGFEGGGYRGIVSRIDVMLQWMWCVCGCKAYDRSGTGKEYDVFWTVGRRRRRE
jgi:hypothetical protein